jgi:hypothetical protein
MGTPIAPTRSDRVCQAGFNLARQAISLSGKFTVMPSNPVMPVLAPAVALALLNALSWHLLLAVACSHRRLQAAFASQRKVISRIAGAVLGAFGLRLLVETVAELKTRPV